MDNQINTFICKKCGKQFTLKRRATRDRIKNNISTDLCKSCLSIERYPEVKKRINETMRRKYGVDNYTESSEFQEKAIKSFIKRHCLQCHETECKYHTEPLRNTHMCPKTVQKGIYTTKQNWGVENVFQHEDIKSKRNETMLNKYGACHSLQVPELLQKCDETTIAHYGKRRAIQTPEIREKQQNSVYEHYGVYHPAQDPSIRKKMKETNIKRYGASHILQTDNGKNKFKQTMQDHHGVNYTAESSKLQQKMKETNRIRFNSDWYAGSDAWKQRMEDIQKKKCSNCNHDSCIRRSTFASNSWECPFVRDKILATNIEKYGVEYPIQAENIKAKIKQTNFDRYGVEYSIQAENIKAKIKQTNFDRYGTFTPHFRHNKAATSGPEISFHKKLLRLFNEGILSKSDYSIVWHYDCISSDNTHHQWDYAIFKNNILQMVIDYDGLYYHGYLGDYNGLQNHELRDAINTSCVPEGVKSYHAIEGNDANSIIDIIELITGSYDDYVKYQYQFCIDYGFPYYKYTDKELLKSYENLSKYHTISDDKYYNHNKQINLHCRIGDRIINHFHRSIYHCTKHGFVSPYYAWFHANDNNERDYILRGIHNRAIYANIYRPHRILQAFSLMYIAPKISIFSASRAKLLISKYLSEYNTIFDPFSGFSGRLLGTVSLGKKYIGRDINHTVIKESNAIIQWFKDHNIIWDANVSYGDCTTHKGSYQSLFTCPPYGDTEIWTDDKKSIKTSISAEQWVSICLRRYTCEKYLFVIDATTKYKEYIAEEISTKIHNGKTRECVILITREQRNKLIKQ